MRKLKLMFCTRCGGSVQPYDSALSYDAPDYDPGTARKLAGLDQEDMNPPLYYCSWCDERWRAHAAGFDHTGALCRSCPEIMDMYADYCGLCGAALNGNNSSVGPHPVRRISSRALWRKLESVVHDVSSGIVFFVDSGQAGAFVLLPETLGSRVMGLSDPEYGWPYPTDLAGITSLEAIRPSHRRHPFITISTEGAPNRVLAVAVWPDEFLQIKALMHAAGRDKPARREES